MFKINRVHHIAIICSDYERSKRFYTQTLGFKIVQENYRAERKSYKLDLEVGERYQIELFFFSGPCAEAITPGSSRATSFSF